MLWLIVVVTYRQCWTYWAWAGLWRSIGTCPQFTKRTHTQTRTWAHFHILEVSGNIKYPFSFCNLNIDLSNLRKWFISVI